MACLYKIRYDIPCKGLKRLYIDCSSSNLFALRIPYMIIVKLLSCAEHFTRTVAATGCRSIQAEEKMDFKARES